MREVQWVMRLLSRRGAYGSRSFVGVRSGGCQGFGAGCDAVKGWPGAWLGYFATGCVCACEEVVESVRAWPIRAGRGPAKTKLDVDAYGEGRGSDEDDGNGNGTERCPSMV